MPLRPKLRMASFEGVRRMVEAGIGIAGAVPLSTVQPYAAFMAIRAVPLQSPWARRDCASCRKIRRPCPYRFSCCGNG